MGRISASIATSTLLWVTVLTGCGGGGDGGATLNGTWRNTAIGAAGSGGGASFVTCPGSATVNGAEISCGANDTVTFTEGTFRNDAPNDEGDPERLIGTYTRSGSNLTVTVTQVATDENRNGVYEASETVTLVTPITLPIQIDELTRNRLVLEIDLTNLGGDAYAATFTR
jgi:hypothetical protein